jgi:vacuolar-type H+-ATPase subunit C/Vma6
MVDYGNARIAVLRARLLDGPALHRLAESGSTAAFLALLERSDDWAPILREVAPLGGDPALAAEAAIERHRSERLGALPGWYDAPARGLVEALVMSLDAERALAILRRRRAGESPESIGTTIVGGALLGPAELGRIARAPGVASAIGLLIRFGLIGVEEGPALVAPAAPDGPAERFERAFAAAVDRTRLARAWGRGPDAALVRAVLAEEGRNREVAAREMTDTGPATAALVERTAELERLDRRARRARRDPLGIGVVAAYVAAVEAQAVRLRAALARVRAGWTPELVGSYLAVGRS